MADDKRPARSSSGKGKLALSSAEAAEFEQLLDFIKRERGFDFTGYRRSSLVRRVSSRMAAVGLEGFGRYLDFLQVDSEEFTRLFNVILINVTGFFRDSQVWDYLAAEVVPKLLDDKGPGQPIRVWSAGCASGEEAYSLAMMLAERLGHDELLGRVKLYGTDVDEDALTIARQATYSAKAVADIPDDLLARYFERSGDTYTFRKDLRGTMIFGRHDLVQDAPISHIDLLACRNTLMYFDAETQSRVLARLHFSLEENGILLLGKAEMLLAHGHLFSPIDLRRRVFTKVTKNDIRDRLSVIAGVGSPEALEFPGDYRSIREVAADTAAVAQIAIHHTGTLAMANAVARATFGLSPSDVGRPFQDLAVSYRPAELRSAIDEVVAALLPRTIEQVHWPDASGQADRFDVHIAPLFTEGETLLGVSVTFVDVTASHRLQDEFEAANRELVMANEELQSTNEELHSTNEELETTNEELQSATEVLEKSNEELQAATQDLEAMNAKLQASNEELQAIDEELRQRASEIDELNDLLESILTSERGGVAVIDRALHVIVWHHRAADLWGFRSKEARGQHFLNLDVGLPTEHLRPALRAILAGAADREEVSLPATNRRGRDFRCRVMLAPLLGKDGDVRGVILRMEEDEGD